MAVADRICDRACRTWRPGSGTSANGRRYRWGLHPDMEQAMQLSGKKIAILATNGFEQSELEIPRDRLKAAGATVDIVSPEAGEIKGWDKKDWGRPVKVDKTLDQVSANE